MGCTSDCTERKGPVTVGSLVLAASLLELSGCGAPESNNPNPLRAHGRSNPYTVLMRTYSNSLTCLCQTDKSHAPPRATGHLSP